MTTVAEDLLARGIRLKSYADGYYKSVCPKCSARRKKKSDQCLSVTIENGSAVWYCHHCEWSEGLRDLPERKFVRPKFKGTKVVDTLVKFFADRGISRATFERLGIGAVMTWMPGGDGKEPAIAFPYTRGGEVINVKYRTRDKRFRQEKDAEKIFYGLDDIEGCDEVIIVEGEIDKLSFDEIGARNVISVPDGAPKSISKDPANDAKFDFLREGRDHLSGIGKFILATDADGPGNVLAEELARRLGREKCWRVKWPVVNDAVLKDANEVLVKEGPDVLRECLSNAEPYPLKGVKEIGEFSDDIRKLYVDGWERTFSTGWDAIDELMKIRPGELSVITGIPNSGKSEFIDALIINLAELHGWKTAICSFENPPAEHLIKLLEKRLRMPFWASYSPSGRTRMGLQDVNNGLDYLQDHIFFLRPGDDDTPNIDWILEQAKMAVLRYGIRGLIIDPYNEIEHKRPHTMTETEYISQILGKVKRFAQAHGCHVWFIAHPAKMAKENGRTPIPTLYDISGSANWANKADIGIVVYRNPDDMPPRAEIFVKKVRFKSVGRIGKAVLAYDLATGVYSEISANTDIKYYDDD